MTTEPPVPVFQPICGRNAILLALGAVVCFHAAYSTPLSFLIFGYVICLVLLARLLTTKLAFYAGMAVGLLCFAPQLGFFWSIFKMFALPLWFILAFWVALFVALTSVAFKRLGPARTVWLAPFLWMGLEYYRSELYYLRFTWLNVGYAGTGSHVLGVYGAGFVSVFVAACMVTGRWKWLLLYLVIPVFALGLFLPGGSFLRSKPQRVQVAGVQLEFPSQSEVIASLNKAVAAHPKAQLFVLSEYTFETPVPEAVLKWCLDKQKYLVIGGIDPARAGHYYNTAFVVGPEGEVIFKQAKSVPIQFFSDGLPAPEQKVWDSPWGKIGICICYDLSYTRVTDPLIRLGARALIVPTMDVMGWGRHEHELHSRIAPVRAAEYEVPIFRVASSGISQLVDASGVEKARAPFGESGAIISGEMDIEDGTSHFQLSRLLLPLDRLLAPFSVVVTVGFILWIPFAWIYGFSRKLVQSRKPVQAVEL